MEVLQNYLHGSEWKESVEIFINANCKLFYEFDEFNHNHYKIWKKYQEVAEPIIESALQNVGGSISLIEDALDELAKSADKGPRDAVEKDVIRKLITFHSFKEFSYMMSLAANELINDNNNKKNTIHNTRAHDETMSQSSFKRDLLALGFDVDMIDMVLEGIDADADGEAESTSLEDLVMKLSELQAISCTSTTSSSKTASINTSSPKRKESKNEYSNRGGGGGGAKNTAGDIDDLQRSSSGNNTRTDLEYLEEFAESLGTGVRDVTELFTKFTTAKSVFDILFEDSAAGDSTHELKEWATDMLELHEEIVRAYELNESCINRKGGRLGLTLPKWFIELESTRRRIDEESSSSSSSSYLTSNGGTSMISDSEIKRMAELELIASLGTEDEQLLHHLLTRYEEVQHDINALHKRMALVVATAADNGDTIKRNSLEELYLFLKEQVGSGVDLELVADELHERVYSTFSSQTGGEVVNVLLDMHILEDEQAMLKQRINSMMMASSPNGNKSSSIPSPSDLNTIGLGLSPRYYAHNSKLAEAKVDHVLNAHARDQSRFEDQDLPFASFDVSSPSPRGNISSTADSKGLNHDISTINNDTKAGSKGNSTAVSSTGSNALYLDDLKNKHKTALQNLKDSLEVEKNRKMKELEDKLLKRRQQRDAVSRHSPGSNSTQQASAEAEQAVVEAERDVMLTKLSQEELIAGVVSGFKKRCINELKTCKTKGRVLTKDEEEDCHREAADALKKRFERDQKSLLESLEAERAKQKAKLLKALEKRQNKSNSMRTVTDSEKEVMAARCRNEIELMHQSFDLQESEAIAKPQRDVLLALSGILMPEELLVKALKKDVVRGVDEDDDDDGGYLDDDDDDDKVDDVLVQRRRKWVDNVDKMRTVYSNAGQQMQKKIRRTQRVNSNAQLEDGIIAGDEVNDVTTHMMGVITEAYCNQLLNDMSSSSLASSIGRDRDTDDSKAKAHILEEFERARSGYEDALSRSKIYSQEKLAARRNRAATNNNNNNNGIKQLEEEGEEEMVQIQMNRSHMAILEEVVDSFLDDPIQSNTIDNAVGQMKEALEFKANNVQREGSGGQSQGHLQLPFTKNVRLAPLPQELYAKLPSPSKAKALDREAKYEYEDTNLGTGAGGGKNERDRIKQDYVEKEKELVDSLYSQMVQQKQLLQDRLRKRREESERKEGAANRTTKAAWIADANANNMDNDDNIADKEDEEDVNKLEQAFENVVNLLKSSKGSELDQVDLGGLMTIMEKFVKGEQVFSLSSVNSAVDGVSAKVKQEDWEYNNKLQMQDEVKRISSVYNEEKQKLDLMLKMQQARQRQNLQRKLLERKRGTII